MANKRDRITVIITLLFEIKLENLLWLRLSMPSESSRIFLHEGMEVDFALRTEKLEAREMLVKHADSPPPKRTKGMHGLHGGQIEFLYNHEKSDWMFLMISCQGIRLSYSDSHQA